MLPGLGSLERLFLIGFMRWESLNKIPSELLLLERLPGRIVVAATFAVFASMRAAEMIRTSICYPKLNVKVIGGYAGLTNGKDGATHQSVEDIAIMRSFANQVVMIPSDAVMTRKMLQVALKYEGPVYIRLEYGDTPTIYGDDLKFEIGKGYLVKEGSDVTLVSYGIALARTLEVANQLGTEGISFEVIDMPTVKPFDRDIILASVKKTGAIVTVEEHSIIGGLASIVSETLVQAHVCPYFRGLGIPDVVPNQEPVPNYETNMESAKMQSSKPSMSWLLPRRRVNKMISGVNQELSKFLQSKACELRSDIVDMIFGSEGSAGHFGGSMSAAEIVTTLYWHVMNIDPKRPAWKTGTAWFLVKDIVYRLFMRLWLIKAISIAQFCGLIVTMAVF